MCRGHTGICDKYIQTGASDVRDDGLGFGFLGLRFRSERGGFQNIWGTCLGESVRMLKMIVSRRAEDDNGDPNIKALRRRGLINHGSTLVVWAGGG